MVACDQHGKRLGSLRGLGLGTRLLQLEQLRTWSQVKVKVKVHYTAPQGMYTYNTVQGRETIKFYARARICACIHVRELEV